MCTEGISHLVMNDETVQELLTNPILDLIHEQVLLNLYSMDANNQLHEYKELLPLYLSKDWSECEDILDTLVQAGLLNWTGNGIELTRPIRRQEQTGHEHACGMRDF
jgi:hypothetical protein